MDATARLNADDGNESFQDLELHSLDDETEDVNARPVPRALDKPRNGRQHLQTPRHDFPRPLSPDGLSNSSTEELGQLQNAPKIRRVVQVYTLRRKVRAFVDHNLGLFYMLLAQLFGSMMNVTTRFLEIEGNKGKGLHPFQILFARMGITVVLASAYMWWKKTPHFPFGMPAVRWLLICRGIGGFFGVFGMYYSLQYIPLADATVITFLAPGLTCWVCSFLIKEPFNRIEKICTLVSVCGVVFIARPASLFTSSATLPASATGDFAPSTNGTVHIPSASDYDSVTPKERLGAVGIALVGVLGAVCAYTTIRWIGKRAHPLISVNYFAAWCTIVSIVMQLAVPQIGFLFPADPKEWLMLFFLGTCGFIMQFLLAAGLSYEKSSRATNMVYTQMLFALSFDKLFFGTAPGVMSIVGSTLILGSAIVMAMQQVKRPNETTGQREGAEDEERGLMGESTLDESGPTANIPVQEVQLRTLR